MCCIKTITAYIGKEIVKEIPEALLKEVKNMVNKGCDVVLKIGLKVMITENIDVENHICNGNENARQVVGRFCVMIEKRYYSSIVIGFSIIFFRSCKKRAATAPSIMR